MGSHRTLKRLIIAVLNQLFNRFSYTEMLEGVNRLTFLFLIKPTLIVFHTPTKQRGLGIIQCK